MSASFTAALTGKHLLLWLLCLLCDYYNYYFIEGDCSDINIANPVSGSYTIYPYGSQNTGVSVYCEFNSEGAWTVCIYSD